MKKTDVFLFYNRTGELVATEFCRDRREAEVAMYFFNMACQECENYTLMIGDFRLFHTKLPPVPGKERGRWIEG